METRKPIRTEADVRGYIKRARDRVKAGVASNPITRAEEPSRLLEEIDASYDRMERGILEALHPTDDT